MNQVSPDAEIDGKAIRTKIVLLAMASGVGSAIIMLLLFGLVARLTPPQAKFIVLVTAGLAPVVLGIIFPIYTKLCQPFIEYLEQRKRGPVDVDLKKRALRAALLCPKYAVIVGIACYPIFSLIVSFIVVSVFDDFDRVMAAHIVICATATGLACQLSMYIPIGTAIDPVRELLAMDIPNVEDRREAAPFLSMARKVTIFTISLTLMAVTLMTFLIQTRSKYGLELYATAGYEKALHTLLVGYEETPDPEALLAKARETYARPLAVEFEILEIGDEVAAENTRFAQSELDWIRQTPDAGNSVKIATPHVYAWIALPHTDSDTNSNTDSVLIAYTLRTTMNAFTHSARTVIVIFSIVVFALIFFTTAMFSGDMRRVFQSFQDQVRRIAEGNLRRVGIVETDDELGELGRSMDEMSTAFS